MPHSEEYFGDTRDHWWNVDFLALMATRWSLSEVTTMLDVGCGVGHWGRALSRVLPSETKITGVDREPAWIAEATRRAPSNRFEYRLGSAEKLPFGDATFDMVTCQTVLIHVPDVRAVIREMMRVIKPGGLVAVAEPNNIGASLGVDSSRFDAPVDELLRLVRFQYICERGKAALGEGNNSIGEMVPGYFAQCGLTDIRVFQSDKASPLIPPYESAEMRAYVKEAADWAARDFVIWSREDTERYFLAGGGEKDQFEALCADAKKAQQGTLRGFADGSLHWAGGHWTYLVSGRKPR